MGKGIFIVGTSTDVGKTYISGLLTKYFFDLGYKSFYYKAAMSGNKKENNIVLPEDGLKVKELSNIDQDLDSMCQFVYEKPYSPHLASILEGNPVKFDIIKKNFLNLAKNSDFLTMEGSGGIICPINIDDNLFLFDIIKRLGLSCILVSDLNLGSINSACLTYFFMKENKIKISGIIFNNYDEKNIIHSDNIKIILNFTNQNLPLLAKVKHNDKKIIFENNINIKNIYEEIVF